MANFTSSQVGLSYPKRKETMQLIVPIARTDSSTPKCALPKGAVVTGVHVLQTVDASTAAGSFVLGWSGSTSALLSAFSMATTKVGLVNAGTSAGASVLTKLDTDKMVLSTYTVGSSTAGGTGYVIIDFFMAEANGGVDD